LQKGLVAARVAAGFEGEEKSFLFSLHVFIPPLKCDGLCLGA